MGGKTSTGAGCVTLGNSFMLQAVQYNALLSALTTYALTTYAFSLMLNKAPRPIFFSLLYLAA